MSGILSSVAAENAVVSLSSSWELSSWERLTTTRTGRRLMPLSQARMRWGRRHGDLPDQLSIFNPKGYFRSWILGQSCFLFLTRERFDVLVIGQERWDQTPTLNIGVPKPEVHSTLLLLFWMRYNFFWIEVYSGQNSWWLTHLMSLSLARMRCRSEECIEIWHQP